MRRCTVLCAGLAWAAGACERNDVGSTDPPQAAVSVEQALQPAASAAQDATPAGRAERKEAAPRVAPAISLDALSQLVASPDALRRAAKSDPISLAWDLFSYVNWPAKAEARGVPDRDAPFGRAGPIVWGTWKRADEVYLDAGKKPDAWSEGDPTAPARLEAPQIDGKVLKDRNGNPVAAEVRMNEATFGYILERELYSYAGQAQVNRPGAQAVSFPATAMEVKASWRLLDPVKDKDVIDRYYTNQVRLPAGDSGGATLVTAGLTSLHIASKAQPDWLWATFEQIDNEQTTGAKLKLLISNAVQKSNAEMAKKFAGTPWQYYRLNGTQTNFVADGKPTLLASTQLETYFQSSSSCMTCHNTASIGPDDDPRFQFFKPNFQGYVGTPPEQPFARGEGGKFTRLDYVWSLRRAQ